ncbi:MAG: HAD-IA family hydrolase [Bacteroidales bacterium]|nr:HAD-IA family hydrolase [Bacteroidales bacterium]
MLESSIKEAITLWRAENGFLKSPLRAALIDMDGVLYDSMKYHTLAWQKMMSEQGVECSRDEFYLYEGMTGAATISLLMARNGRPELSDEEVKRLYAIKTEYFRQLGKKEPMPGADRMLEVLRERGIKRVLVTGSAQSSLINALAEDYPGAFLPGMMVTALDVNNGKPHPEPYLRGLEKAGVTNARTIVIENAPLGVRAGRASGCFTVAVTTGPVPREAFVDAGANLIFPSMNEFADALPTLIDIFDE